MSPTVSVVIPNLNMGVYLDDALRSIARQSVPVDEILIADTGSTDETLEVVARHQGLGLPIRLIEVAGASPAVARNRAIEIAKGEVIGFLDADDLWPEGKLERQLARLARQPAVEMVSGYTCYFEVPDRETLEPASGARTETLFHVHVGACLYRRGVFGQIGGAFDESLVYSEDVDLLLRLREQGVPFTILRSIELFYRKHAASMMARDDPRKDASFRLVAHRSLLRRRSAGRLGEPLPDFAAFLEPLA